MRLYGLLFDKTKTSLKISVLAAYTVDTVLSNLRKNFKMWLIQRGHDLLAVLMVEAVECEGVGETYLGYSADSVFGYIVHYSIDAKDMIQVM